MPIDAIIQRLCRAGAKPAHTARVLRRWTQATKAEAEKVADQDYLPAGVRALLPTLFAELADCAQIVAEHPADDGSARLLVKLADGQTIECVLLPRNGVCVSTQVGCAVGCMFCMTGQSGLLRQLDSTEIVAQVILARHRHRVKKVVFMGMGEPAHSCAARYARRRLPNR